MADKKRVVGIALCGFGRAGQIHFNGIRQNHNCKLKYVVDMIEVPSVLERINSALVEYHMTSVRPVSKDQFEEIVLKDDEIEAVVVATPTDTHEYYTRHALEAGRGVFCEKPVADNPEDVAACFNIAEKNSRPLFCAFNRRFDPGMRNVWDQVRAGKIGKLYQIKTCARDSPLPQMSFLKNSGGMFHDCAVHDIDLACWIVGEAPVRVIAEGSAFDEGIRSLGDVDTIAIILKFPSGVIASLELSRHSACGYDQRLEVSGSTGMLQVGNVHEDSVINSSPDGICTKPFQHSFPQRYKEAYIKEMEHFVQILRDPSTPHCVTKEDVLLSSRVAGACELSCKTGRAVDMSEIK